MRFPALLLFLLSLSSTAALAAVPEYQLVIRGHRFVPSELVVPAGQKVKLVVINEDATPEELESHALNREKIVSGKARINVYVGPLPPGRYPFFGEFHMDTVQGVLVAR